MDRVTARRNRDAGEQQRLLSRRLLTRLRPLAHDPALSPGKPGLHSYSHQLFRYCCFERERVAQVRKTVPVIGIIVSGFKEFWLGDASQHFEAGTVFVLPPGPEFTVVNIPDNRNGRFEALLVEVEQVPREIACLPSRRSTTGHGFDLKVRLSAELVETLAHATMALCASDHAATLARYRLAEVLALLRDEPAARPLFCPPLTDRIAWLVLGAPDRQWTAAALGRELGLAASTLRRQLADRGTSLRRILAAVRMEIAYRILTAGEGNVSQAAAAAGYASRSHFVRRYRSVYGALPSTHRTPRTSCRAREVRG